MQYGLIEEDSHLSMAGNHINSQTITISDTHHDEKLHGTTAKDTLTDGSIRSSPLLLPPPHLFFVFVSGVFRFFHLKAKSHAQDDDLPPSITACC